MTFPQVIIGDVHEKLIPYYESTKKYNSSVQVGDLGFKTMWDVCGQLINSNNHKCVMGNHDYIPYVGSHKMSLGDYFYKDSISYIRGAESIDKYLRLEGYDYFSNEELSYNQMLKVFDKILEDKPRIIVSHTCPNFIGERIINKECTSNTSKMLSSIFEEYQPEQWVFGHFHKSWNEEINGCKFRCLNELEIYKL